MTIPRLAISRVTVKTIGWFIRRVILNAPSLKREYYCAWREKARTVGSSPICSANSFLIVMATKSLSVTCYHRAWLCSVLYEEKMYLNCEK